MRHSQCKWAKNKAYVKRPIRFEAGWPDYTCTATIYYGREQFLIAGWGFSPGLAARDFWTEYRKVFLSLYGSVPKLIY